VERVKARVSRAALDRAVYEGLRPSSLCLGLLFLFFAVAHRVVLPPDAALPLAALALLSSIAFLGLAEILRRRRIPIAWAHPLAFAMASLALANGALHLQLLAEPSQAAYLILIVVGCGLVFLSWPWLAAIIFLTWAAWVAAFRSAQPSPDWQHFGFALAAASALAPMLLSLRLAAHRRAWQRHVHERHQLRQLRRAARASQAELEKRVEQRTAELVAANAALRAEVDERVRAADRAQRFARAIETCTDGIVLADADGRITELNDAMVEMFGAEDKGALIGRLTFELVVPDDERRARSTIDQLYATGSSPSQEYQIVRFDGQVVPIEAAVALISESIKDAHGFVVVVRDVTERRRFQDALRRSEAYFRALVENSADVIVVFDERGAIRARPSLEALSAGPFGHRLPQIVERLAIDAVHPDDAASVVRTFRASLKTPETTPTLEFRVRRRDGSWATAEATFRNLLDDPAVAGVVATVRDRSARKAAEDELRRAKEEAEAANRAKTDFLATISHELRSPLHAIIGYTDLLREEAFGRVEPEQGEALARIRSRADSLFELISAVLDLSAMDADRLRLHVAEVDLRNVLAEVEAETRELWAPSGLEMRWDVDPGVIPVLSDAGKIKVVVKNLVSNAIRFTDRGGIATSVKSVPGGVEIRVKDTGVGIPESGMATIFEAFRQLETTPAREIGGTGLGLHIVARLLVLLHGSIDVESEVGRGSTFFVRLPQHIGAGAEPPSSELASTRDSAAPVGGESDRRGAP
jgi:PAS domain S-box-containing protein